LIFVHEFGHFITARRNGVRAEEFGFGFPPRIFGIQPMRGKRLKKIAGVETIDIEITDYKTENGTEVIKEIATDRIKEVDQVVEVRKWRWIWGKRNTKEEWKEEPGMKSDTIYSLNWIPLGGFVKIKGEDGSGKNDPDSFASHSAWTRIKILFAGVAMNFILAWLLITITLIIGAPQAVEDDAAYTIKNPRIQISQVMAGSPAEEIGLKIGDEIIRCQGSNIICEKKFASVSDVQEFINENKGKGVSLEIQRGSETLAIKGTPRVDYPEDQGPLGISLVRTAIVKYSWPEAVWKGLTSTIDLIVIIVVTFYNIIKDLLVGEKVSVDVTGPVGIAFIAKQVTDLGLVYILQFAALLSINLGIINGLPFPALDGGRILFILIEKVKGSPISQKYEQLVHSVGFILLIMLMIFITFRDVIRFDLLDKVRGIL
jgi:regulator of sigma E protease